MSISHSKAVATSVRGYQVRINVRDHELMLDEPTETPGGLNSGITPVETLLSAVGGCKIIMAKSFAHRFGIKLNGISVTVEGELDRRGYLAQDDSIRPGLPKIWCTYQIDANNTDAEIAEFIKFVDHYCPVADTITNGAEITTQIERINLNAK